MALIESVLDGRLRVSEIYKDRLATCTGCLACEAQCASGVPVTEIIHAAKEQAVREAGRGIIEQAITASLKHRSVMRSLAWLAPFALHVQGKDLRGFGRRHRRSGLESNLTDRGSEGKRVVFFPGCAIRYFQQDIERAVIAVLEGLGYGVVVPEAFECCGRPLLSLGDGQTARALAARNTDLLASLNADAVVTACASCGLTFQREYPRLLAPLGKRMVPVVDIHAFLAGKVAGLDLAPESIQIAWHDPCHLGRGQGLGGTARSVLRDLPGLSLIELQEPARCCGFGGVMRATHPLLSRQIGEAKARDIIASGAPVVATGCPGCRMQIADSLRRAGSDVEVLHTVQVIEHALVSRSQKREVRNDRRIRRLAGSAP
jgi:glycolate oxidase iron-sulfur subunit